METVKKVVQNFVDRGGTHSFHIDEIVEAYEVSTSEKLFNESIRVLKEVIESLITSKAPIFKVELFVELIGERSDLKGAPKELSLLIDEIDLFSMPEVFISIPVKEYWQPKIETYTCPLTFDFGMSFEKLTAFYYEYRTFDQMLENDTFDRWVIFSYIEG